MLIRKLYQSLSFLWISRFVCYDVAFLKLPVWAYLCLANMRVYHLNMFSFCLKFSERCVQIIFIAMNFVMCMYYHVCSAGKYVIVLSPTAPNASYEDIDLNVIVEYSGPQQINSSVPLLFRYAGNPDINTIRPKRIRNRLVYFTQPNYPTVTVLTSLQAGLSIGGYKLKFMH